MLCSESWGWARARRGLYTCSWIKPCSGWTFWNLLTTGLIPGLLEPTEKLPLAWARQQLAGWHLPVSHAPLSACWPTWQRDLGINVETKQSLLKPPPSSLSVFSLSCSLWAKVSWCSCAEKLVACCWQCCFYSFLLWMHKELVYPGVNTLVFKSTTKLFLEKAKVKVYLHCAFPSFLFLKNVVHIILPTKCKSWKYISCDMEIGMLCRFSCLIYQKSLWNCMNELFCKFLGQLKQKKNLKFLWNEMIFLPAPQASQKMK